MQAAAAFNRAAFTVRPLHRPPRPLPHLGAPLTRPRCSRSLSVGVGSYGSEHTPVFPRQQSWDPYKLLGVDHDASEEEVWSARNFLLKQYAGYEESEEAIEGAYDKIIMNSYSHRKKSKINLKSKLKKQVEESPSWLKALLGYFEVPSLEIISRRLAFFAFFAGWSIATSAETGPAFQCLSKITGSWQCRPLGHATEATAGGPGRRGPNSRSAENRAMHLSSYVLTSVRSVPLPLPSSDAATRVTRREDMSRVSRTNREFRRCRLRIRCAALLLPLHAPPAESTTTAGDQARGEGDHVSRQYAMVTSLPLRCQIALSLVSCIYFLNEKMKNLVRASTTGIAVFVGGWILGSFLVPVIPAFIIPPTWSLELLTSLMAYVFMFLGCTFLK